MNEIYDSEIRHEGVPGWRPIRLGIIGGGQLAKMTALAALPLGCDVVVLERNPFSPAARLSPDSMVGDWNDGGVLDRFAAAVDVITLENEFVDASALAALERDQHRVFPSAACIAVTQDKLTQKQALESNGLSVSGFKPVQSPDEVISAAAELGWPLVLKKRRNGYDGKGNYTLRSEGDVAAGWQQLDGDQNDLFVEAFCVFSMELAVIVTRGIDGATAVYPVVETVQRDHICHVVKAPAEVSDELRIRAGEMARRAVEAVGGTGSFGVEMFLSVDGELLINELAPRVHNSGHYTIEACECSQFENHVRAVLGMPLGSTKMIAPAAVMLNLIGTQRSPGKPHGLDEALRVPGAHLHIYGKAMSGPGRKMGHVSALGDSLGDALSTAERAAGHIQF